MTNPYTLRLTMHEVSGLWDSLGICLFVAEYRSADGTWFRNEEFLYRKGAIRYFTDCFGGWGMMSGQMMGSALYYTYSWGSGIHRSHIGRLSIDHDTIVIRESGGYADKDLYVAEPENGVIPVFLYKIRKMISFNELDSSAVKWGYVHEGAASISIIDTLGNEITPNFTVMVAKSRTGSLGSNDSRGKKYHLSISRKQTMECRFDLKGRVLTGAATYSIVIHQLPMK